jgi:two-component system chemotaxis response regulator CheB
MTTPIRVLVVDDSSLARAMLRSILEDDGGFEVIGEAVNGRDAVDLCRRLMPDLVTMDLEMPVMGGLEAIEEIMGAKAVPILVVSGVADAQKAYTAVSHGAIEVIPKPSMSTADVERFTDMARLVAKIPVITHMRRRQKSPSGSAAAEVAAAQPPLAGAIDSRIVAIASSTGGPQALAHLLAKLPIGFPHPVVVAQHISDGFAQGMADWLAGISALPVRIGREGELLTPGTVYISPSEGNMTVTGSRRIALASRTADQVYRPSCDALLNSVATIAGNRSVGIILTGMGRDGVAGMEAISRVGGLTLAQDEASSVIFGMNAVAIEKGWVSKVLPLDALANAMCALVPRGPA